MTLYDYSRNDLFSLNYNLIHQCAFFSQNISLFSESDFSPPHHNTLKCLLEKVDELRFSKIIVRIWGKRTFFSSQLSKWFLSHGPRRHSEYKLKSFFQWELKLPLSHGFIKEIPSVLFRKADVETFNKNIAKEESFNKTTAKNWKRHQVYSDFLYKLNIYQNRNNTHTVAHTVKIITSISSIPANEYQTAAF